VSRNDRHADVAAEQACKAPSDQSGEMRCGPSSSTIRRPPVHDSRSSSAATTADIRGGDHRHGLFERLQELGTLPESRAGATSMLRFDEPAARRKATGMGSVPVLLEDLS